MGDTVPKQRDNPGENRRALAALKREVERLSKHSAKLMEELEELRRHVVDLYLKLAPLDRPAGRPKPHLRGK